MSKKVMIDAGHAPNNANKGKNGYYEYSGMWKLSNYLKIALERCGLVAALTRAENDDPSLTARDKKAVGYDLFISEHTNAANGAARGVEVFYSLKIPADKEFAAALARDVSAYMKNANRGAKTRESTNTVGANYYTVMFEAQRVGAAHVLLIESGFHDNTEDEAILLKDENLKAMSEIQAKIICQYLNVTYAATTPAAPAPQLAAEQPQPESTVKFDLFGQKTVDIKGRIIDGVTHVQAQSLLEAMEFFVGWDNATNTIIVRVRTAIQVSAEELTILEKIVHAEASGEDRKGKTLVVNVIFNRVKAKGYPNTIKDVVFAPQQFEPTRNGAYDKTIPSQDTKAAVQDALNGADYSQGALFFRTVKGATPECWHETALTVLFDHGGHRFYV